MLAVASESYPEVIVPVVGIAGCGKSRIVRQAIEAFNGAILTGTGDRADYCRAFAIVGNCQYHLLCLSGDGEIDRQRALFTGAERAIFVFDTEPQLFEKQSVWWSEFKRLLPAEEWFFILNKSDIYQVRDKRTFLASFEAYEERPTLQMSAVSAKAPAHLKSFFSEHVFRLNCEES